MKKWLTGIAILLLAGCGGPAGNIKESDGASAGTRMVMMTGGYIDEAGKGENPDLSQLNPWIEIDRQSGIAGYMGLSLKRVVGDPEIFRTHAPRYLGVEVGDELRVTVGATTVVMQAVEVSKRWHKNQQDAGGFRTTTYFEEARFQAGASDMELLAKGPITRISVSGKKGGTVWPRQDRKLLPGYQSQVSAFYKEQIAPAL